MYYYKIRDQKYSPNNMFPYTLMFYRFLFFFVFLFSNKVNVFFFRFLLIFFLSFAGTAKSTSTFSFFFFFLIIIRFCHLFDIRWSVCISKSQKSLCISFTWTDSGLCIYHLFVWPNLKFLHNSQWITFPTQSCLVLYSICTNLLHSLIIWLIISFPSPHNLHVLFCCVLSNFVLT